MAYRDISQQIDEFLFHYKTLVFNPMIALDPPPITAEVALTGKETIESEPPPMLVDEAAVVVVNVTESVLGTLTTVCSLLSSEGSRLATGMALNKVNVSPTARP